MAKGIQGMATFTVNTAADVVDGNFSQLSLREAVSQANATVAADTIVFAGALEGQALVLTGGELQVTRDLTIEGDTDQDGTGVTIDGNQNGRLLHITGSATDVELSGLTLTGGAVDSGQDGGAVLFSGSSLTVEASAIVDNQAGIPGGVSQSGDGGGICAVGGRVVVIDSEIVDNYSASGGGGIDGSGIDLTVRSSQFVGNDGVGGGGIGLFNSALAIEDSKLTGNRGGKYGYLGSGGGISVTDSTASIARCSINSNSADYAGGVSIDNSRVVISDSTIAHNVGSSDGTGFAGGIGVFSGQLQLRNSTITGNRALGSAYELYGGGICLGSGGALDIANSIVAGNRAQIDGNNGGGYDIFGTINLTNGHNVFGTDVAGNNPGDRENIAASAIFASIDPTTGGGQLAASGLVPLLNSTSNPALSGADPLAASATGQLGTSARPQPVGSLPDIGSIEINQPLSTTASARNDVLTGTAAGNTINAVAGNDFVKGLGGKDTLNGGDGSDLLDGGTGNDKLNGGGGVDLVTYAGSAKVVFDLSGHARHRQAGKRDRHADRDRRGDRLERRRCLQGQRVQQLFPGGQRQGQLHRRQRPRPLRFQRRGRERGRRDRLAT